MIYGKLSRRQKRHVATLSRSSTDQLSQRGRADRKQKDGRTDFMRAPGTIFCAALAAVAATADAGMVARARADFVQTARLDLKDSASGRNRVGEPAKTDLEQVIARYSQTIMVHPADDNAYFRRGIANLYAGSASKARADIAKASELDPQYPYYELWLHLIDQRLNQLSRLGEALSRFEMTKWPAPILRLFLGKAMVPEVLAAADDPDSDSDTRRGQLCEANFYIAQLALKQGAKGEAIRLFRLAATDCPHDFVEGPAASAELTAMSKDQ